MDKHTLFKSASALGPTVRAIFPDSLVKTAKADPYEGWEIADEIRAFIKTITPQQRKDNCYVLVNALGASEYYGPNINSDWFSWDQLCHEGTDYGHKTFLTAHVFQHHQNKNPEKSIGRICLSLLNHKMKRVELVLEINRKKASSEGADGIVSRIEAGDEASVSMGCRVAFDRCMVCGHEAPTRDSYCKHMRPPPELRGVYGPNKILPDGRIICVDNPKPRFFDLSFVFIGADKTAKSMAKLASKGKQVCLGPVCEVSLEKTAGLGDFIKHTKKKFQEWFAPHEIKPDHHPDIHKQYLGEHEGFKVQLVDGPTVKKAHAGNTGEDFGGWGTSLYHPFVPKDELWVEKWQHKEVPHLAKLAKLEKEMKDEPFSKIREAAQKTLTTPGPDVNPIKTIKYGDMPIHFVDGAQVRKQYDPHFVLGGHNYVYKYIPKGEIWIDVHHDPNEYGRTIAHELDEYNWMSKGDDYHTAHNKSLVTENRPYSSHSLDYAKKTLAKEACATMHWEEDGLHGPCGGLCSACEKQASCHSEKIASAFERALMRNHEGIAGVSRWGGEVAKPLIIGAATKYKDWRHNKYDHTKPPQTDEEQEEQLKEYRKMKRRYSQIGRLVGSTGALVQSAIEGGKTHPMHHAIRGLITVPLGETAAREWFDRRYGVRRPTGDESKLAAAKKLSEIIKDVPSTSLASRSLASLEKAEKSLPRNTLDHLADHPLSTTTSGMAGLGMILKPQEFQRIVLVRMGEKNLADDLDGANQVFRPSSSFGELGPSGDIVSSLSRILPLIAGFAKDRSAFGSPLVVRISVSTTPQNSLPTLCGCGNSLLDKLGAAYNSYRSNTLLKLAEAAHVVQSDPQLRELLFGDEMLNAFTKTASVPDITRDSIGYLMGAYMHDRSLLTKAALAGAMEATDLGLISL